MRLPFTSPKPVIGWYGKVPAVGDFAGRGLDGELLAALGDWCAAGMEVLSTRPDGEWRDAYMLSPVWFFVMTPGVWSRAGLVGCMAPSIDRIGRCSPLFVLRSIDKDGVDHAVPPRSRWLWRVEEVVRQAVSAKTPVDQILPAILGPDADASYGGNLADKDASGSILMDLGIHDAESTIETRFVWSELIGLFNERPRRSFWWAEPSPKQPPRQVIHNGMPDVDLFSLLMGGWITQSPQSDC